MEGNPAGEGGGQEHGQLVPSTLVSGPAAGGQEKVGVSSFVDDPAGGGQEVTEPPSQEEMFLADEGRWENMKSDTDRSIDKGSVNLRESVKATGIWQEQFNVCRALSDGRCGAHCIALHIYNDQNREKEVMNKLNKHILENWEHFKDHFSFPYSHSIGIGNTDKVFQTETHLKNFIQNDQNALNMWMDHPWLQAAANIYNINIQILTTGI